MNTVEHLLTCLGEEGSEISQDCSKAMRFGLKDVNVMNPKGPNNTQRIVNELNDLMGVVELCVTNGILPHNWRNERKIYAKKKKVIKFMIYARQKRTLIG